MKVNEYYSENLSANKLKKCYDIAPSRIKQYLNSEIRFLQKNVKKTDVILELGCGYGRVLIEFAEKAKMIYGVDISQSNLDFGENFLSKKSNIKLLKMNAGKLEFDCEFFDVVFAMQNGISAFNIDPIKLIKESLRVTKIGGKVIYSSYSDKIWEERLKWFIQQSNKKLIGEIDFSKTKDGTIVCKDGFKATTYYIKDFINLKDELELDAIIKEIDESSIVFIISK